MSTQRLSPRPAGYAAFRAGQPIEACPSRWTPASKRHWRDGWREAFHLSHTPNGTPAEAPDAPKPRKRAAAYGFGDDFEPLPIKPKGGAR